MSYEVNGIKYDSWSSKNQAILDYLVNREVYCCFTSEMEYMLSRVEQDEDNPFSMDDLLKQYLPCCPECDTTYGFEELTVADMKDEDFETEKDYVESDELEDGFLCPVCGCWYKTIDDARNCCGEDEIVYKCCECGKIVSKDDYDSLDVKPEEIYEWWAVSPWFGEKLSEQGCVVIESYGKSFWGRATTGQAISLDGCIFNIAKDMNILEGMENEWKVP